MRMGCFGECMRTSRSTHEIFQAIVGSGMIRPCCSSDPAINELSLR